jgi:nicotinate-nucleotide--dimethylbenzimidazole phosphoribosyltransferase
MSHWRDISTFAVDQAAEAAARERTAELGIPTGSLGRLHEIAIWLASVGRSLEVRVDRCTVIAFCGDHGVVARGVSSLPQHVTWTNMKYMAEGNAVISIYARLLGARLCIVDIGVNGPRYSPIPVGPSPIDFRNRRVKNGTEDIFVRAAMSLDELDQALQAGYEVAESYVNDTDVYIFGEMGIGNTTSCSAIIAGLFNEDANSVTGFGSGISEETRKLKVGVIEKSVDRARRGGNLADPVFCLKELGGFEIAGIVGGMLAAAANRKPIILDGFICTTAFALASVLAPGLSNAVVAGTYSAEPGYATLSRRLRLAPILNLGMRLGEGTGAILAWPIVRAAAEQLRQGVTKSELVIDFQQH